MQDELHQLLRVERLKVVKAVTWAVGNGNRSENGNYIYGKCHLREIDRRIRFLSTRLESAEVVDPTMACQSRSRIWPSARTPVLTRSTPRVRMNSAIFSSSVKIEPPNISDLIADFWLYCNPLTPFGRFGLSLV